MSNKFFDYFPPPRFLEMPYVGISISPKAVRFIEILRAKKGFEVGRYGERDLSTYNPTLSLKENRELVEALRSLRKEHSLTYIECSLPEEKAYVFKMAIPNKDEAEVRNYIEFHLEENVPLSLEESIFDYHRIDDKEAAISVLPRVIVEEYIDLLQSVGLTPISFLVESQATAKAVIKKGNADTHLIIQINETRTEFSIVSNESVLFTSTVVVGSDDLNNAIVKKFNVSLEEAKKMKREKGFVRDEKNSDLFFALVSVASVLKDEIERIYLYWRNHGDNAKAESDQKIQKILLLGADASLIGFKEYLSESVRLELEIANVWTNAFSFDDYIPPIEREEALNYGPAIGLALPKL